MRSLATKYRPQTFDDIVSQNYVKSILTRQLETHNLKHCYLFAGPSGTGKTTLARVFANQINGGHGQAIEIDAASHNSVEDVRDIVEGARLRSLDSEYKIYIIDEVQSITTQGWQAFLKTIEEPPEKTVFMFCTTNPEKIPLAVQNRVMRFNLSLIPIQMIAERLRYICEKEQISDPENCCDYIAKLSNGGMRDAITYLEKVSDYSPELSLANTLEILGTYAYDDFLKLTNAIVDNDEKIVLEILQEEISAGKEVRNLVDEYIKFLLDLTKYSVFKDISMTYFPALLEDKVKFAVGFEHNLECFNLMIAKLLELKNIIRYDDNSALTIQAFFVSLLQEVKRLW